MTIWSSGEVFTSLVACAFFERNDPPRNRIARDLVFVERAGGKRILGEAADVGCDVGRNVEELGWR